MINNYYKMGLQNSGKGKADDDIDKFMNLSSSEDDDDEDDDESSGDESTSQSRKDSEIIKN